jgi:hypothetical protein
MDIPWWLHRALLIVTMTAGALGGAIASLYAVGVLDRHLGAAVVVVYPAGFLLGAMVPHQVFRRWIHATCPHDGERMTIERVQLPKRYAQEVSRSGTRYRCRVCGTIK